MTTYFIKPTRRVSSISILKWGLIYCEIIMEVPFLFTFAMWCNWISWVTCYHLCRIPSVTGQVTGTAQTQGKGVTQRCEHQQVGITGVTFGSLHCDNIGNGKYLWTFTLWQPLILTTYLVLLISLFCVCEKWVSKRIRNLSKVIQNENFKKIFLCLGFQNLPHGNFIFSHLFHI